jgi:uncharacterized repeat protein (TIGR01451 family)
VVLTYRTSVPADVLTIAILAHNNTDGPLRNTRVSDPLDPSLHFLPGSLALNGQPIPIIPGIASFKDHTISVNTGHFRPRDRLLVTFAATRSLPKGVVARARPQPPLSP